MELMTSNSLLMEKTIYVLCSIRITRNSRERSWVGDVGIIFYREIHAEEWKLLEKNQQEVDDNGFSSIYFSPDGKTNHS